MNSETESGTDMPPARPRWLRVLSFLMLLMAAHVGFQGVASLGADPVPPADTAVVLSGNEARLRAFQLATSIMHEQYGTQVQLHAVSQVVMCGILLFAVAAIFTRDPNGRRLAIGAACAVGIYQVLHAAFAILIERPALLVVLPDLMKQLEGHGEPMGEAAADQAGLELATLVGPVFFLLLGLALTVVMLVFFAGRRGRILYGVEKPPVPRPQDTHDDGI